MRKMLKTLNLLLFVLISSSIIGQSSTSNQKTLITKRTATWCPNCGSWGWDMAKGIEGLDNANGVLIRAHHSGNLQSQVAKDITENFNAEYQPEFYINENRQDVGSTTWSAKVEMFKEEIEANAFQEANVSIRIRSTFEGAEVNTEVTVEALKDLEGEFYLGSYILEDSILDVQSGRGNEVVHNSVLRSSFTESSFGERILEDNLAKGSKAEFTSTLELEGEVPSERFLRNLVIVWRKEGDLYRVENVHAVTTSQFSSSKEVENQSSKFKIYQSTSGIVIEREDLWEDNALRADLLTIDGKTIGGKQLNRANKNEIFIDVNKWSGQIVLVRISGQNDLIQSKKLFIK